MSDINKIKKEFDDMANDAVSSMNLSITGLMYHIMRTYDITESDLSELLGVSENIIKNFNYSECDIYTLAKLCFLSKGLVTLPGCSIDYTDNEKTDNIINQYKAFKSDENNTSKCCKGITYDKIANLLNLFGVNNNESFDRLINAITEVRNSFDKAEEDYGDNECKIELECDDVNEDKITTIVNEGKILGSYYNSETMDKPEKFEYEINNLDDKKQLSGLIDALADFYHDIVSKNR